MKHFTTGAVAIAFAIAVAPSANAATTIYTPGDPQFQVTGDPFNGTVSATIGHTGIVSGAFTDIFQFTLGQTGLGSGSLSTSTSKFHGPTDVDITSVTINGALANKTVSGGGIIEFFDLTNVPIQLGVLNSIIVTGIARGNGSYGGNVTFTPAAVPEPASWALMVLGFGAMGASLRGRRKAAVSFG